MKTILTTMWRGNPLLMMVLLGLPFGFLSLICYGICCSDLLDANDDEDGNFFSSLLRLINFHIKIIYGHFVSFREYWQLSYEERLRIVTINMIY